MKSALDVHTTLLERGVPHEIVRLRGRVLTAHDLPRVLDLPSGCLAVRCYVVERSAGGPAQVTAGGPAQVTAGGPAQVTAGGPADVAAGGPALVAVLAGAGAVPSPTALLDALDARVLRAATSDEVSSATDFAAGLVSPVGLPDSVTLLADAAVEDSDVSYCALGEAGVALGIRTTDLLATTGARVLPLTRSPAPGPGDGTSAVLHLDGPGATRRARRSTGRSTG